MKMTCFIATLALNLTSVFAIEWDSILPEINQKSRDISKNLIAADHTRKEWNTFYGDYLDNVDSQESLEHRRKAQEDIQNLEKLANILVHKNAAELAQNLHRFPQGIQIEEGNFMTEPMMIFYKFTGLGLATEILNSLRDQPHPNFSNYPNTEKVKIAQHILKYASNQAEIGSKFWQLRCTPEGFLFREAVNVSQLASALIKNFSK